jgi:structural maintenance of chromosomes flexible hinge domain-containing protein 1
VTLVDQVNSQSPEQHGFVVSGQPFAVEIEALDKHNNRCRGGAAVIPHPEITLESTMPLDYNAEEWERGWVAQGNEEVYNVRMTVGGHPGEVIIKVKDSAASDKSSLLLEDCLTVDLRAGPPAALAFEGAASMDCGTRAVLGNVEVVLRDAAGYPTKSTETFEVTLAGSALSADGSGRAAKVVANNANKAKITKGKSSAVFKGVTVTAEAPGTYALRVQSASRKVALQEGVLQLAMAPISAVTGLQVVVPPELCEGGQVGVANRLLIAAETENGEVLPEDAAVAGLTLKLTPPGGNRNDIIVCTLPAAEEGESLPIESGCYSFALSELTVAGTWTAAAEYAESRADVRAAVGKNADIRSSAVQFTLLAGPPVTAVVEAPQLPDRATVTNASAAKARLLVRNAAAQVQDAYGNVAEAEGVQLRFRLCAASDSMPPGSVIPTLEAEEGLDTPKHLDDRGRAYFGKLSIVEGSGAAPAGPIDLELICEALGLYPSSDVELEMDEEGWTVCWKCPVLFSDNTAQFGAVEKLNEQRGALLERREDIQRRWDEAQQALAVAEKQGKRAAQAAEAVQNRVAGDLPATVKAAERQLKKLEKSAEGGEAEEVRRAPRWGPLKAPLTASINVALRANTGGLIGVLAQLITIDDDRLATVASAALRPSLGVVVVEDKTSRTNLEVALTAKKYPMPDVLPLTQVNTYRGPKQGEIPGFSAAGDVAKTLTRSACAGTDRPLCIALPHQRSNSKDAGGSSSINWPEGCLGYLCNLVRPVHPGHRATIIYGLLSGTLVFESLDHATAYREYVTQTMKMPFSNEMLCLDGSRVTGRGIISGSTFRPPPLDHADFVIGSGEGAPGGGAADKIQGLQSWLAVLQEKEAAEASVAAAQKEIDSVERTCRPELDAVDGELADVDAQIAQLQRTPGDAAGSHQKHQQKSGKHQRKRQSEEERVEDLVDVEAEAEEDEPAAEPKARTKRRRLVKGG